MESVLANCSFAALRPAVEEFTGPNDVSVDTTGPLCHCEYIIVSLAALLSQFGLSSDNLRPATMSGQNAQEEKSNPLYQTILLFSEFV